MSPIRAAFHGLYFLQVSKGQSPLENCLTLPAFKLQCISLILAGITIVKLHESQTLPLTTGRPLWAAFLGTWRQHSEQVIDMMLVLLMSSTPDGF